MDSVEHNLFELLKKEIADTYRKVYPSCDQPIEEWKGQEIVNFQEELITKVKGRISEKWFYTHIKSKSDKLPRIDMLNMLSEYAGYKDWQDFTKQKGDFTKPETFLSSENNTINEETPAEKVNTPPEDSSALGKKFNQGIILAGLALLTVLFLTKDKSKLYRGCFTDMNGKALIANSKLEVFLLKDQESPLPVECNEQGCFELESDVDRIQYIVYSPYYEKDTITRNLKQYLTEEKIKLRTNDYALMIHYFSTSNISDWKQRRLQLEDMITENAKIFQVYTDGNGMELYNRREFINKLTMPLKSLKNIEIIETHYSGNQISLLRFIQQERK